MVSNRLIDWSHRQSVYLPAGVGGGTPMYMSMQLQESIKRLIVGCRAATVQLLHLIACCNMHVCVDVCYTAVTVGSQ